MVIRKRLSWSSNFYLQTHKLKLLNLVACKAFTHTYRAHFSCFSWSKSCWCCSCDFAHRLQSFASNWHFLFVVIIVSFLLTHKQFVWVAGKIWWTLGHVFRVWLGRLSSSFLRCCSICRMLFNFGLPCNRRFFSFLSSLNDGMKSIKQTLVPSFGK